MAHPVEKRIEVKRLLDAGCNQEEAAARAGVPDRVIRYWLQKGKLDNLPAADTLPEPPTSSYSKRKRKYTWTKIDAATLTEIGTEPFAVPLILASLEIAKKQGNDRVHRYLNSHIRASKQWPGMPECWRGIIAGFPIVAEDIGSPSLARLAALVEELQPYLSEILRREYHRRVQPILIGLLAEVQLCFSNSYPLIVWPDVPKSIEGPRGVKEAQEALVKGRWTYMIPVETQSWKLKDTWPGVLYDLVARLPDPDKQQGKFHKKHQLSLLLQLWCTQPLDQFSPPLPAGQRRTDTMPYRMFANWQRAISPKTANETANGHDGPGPHQTDQP